MLISDYNKGVCKGEMIPRLVQLAQRHGRAGAGRPGQGRRLSPLCRLHVHHAEPCRGGPGRGHADHHAPGRPRGRAAAAGLRRRVGRRHARPRRHGLGRPLRPGAAVPRPAAAGLRHHRGRRHGAGRRWAICWRPAPIRPRPSRWPTWPAGWRSSGWASCRSPAARSWPRCPSAAAESKIVVPGPTGRRAAAGPPGRPADRHDQRLLRPAPSRPRRLAGGGPPTGRLPAGGRQQRPQRAGDQGAGPADHRPAGPGRHAGRPGLRRLRRRLRRRQRRRAWSSGSCPTCWSRPISTASTRSWATRRCWQQAGRSPPRPL